jgi:hypothetical protein
VARPGHARTQPQEGPHDPHRRQRRLADRAAARLSEIAGRSRRSIVHLAADPPDASREIRRLKSLPPSDTLPAEFDLDAESAAREANADVPITAFEIAGYGSNCRWSH